MSANHNCHRLLRTRSLSFCLFSMMQHNVLDGPSEADCEDVWKGASAGHPCLHCSHVPHIVLSHQGVPLPLRSSQGLFQVHMWCWWDVTDEKIWRDFTTPQLHSLLQDWVANCGFAAAKFHLDTRLLHYSDACHGVVSSQTSSEHLSGKIRISIVIIFSISFCVILFLLAQITQMTICTWRAGTACHTFPLQGKWPGRCLANASAEMREFHMRHVWQLQRKNCRLGHQQ